MTDGGDSGRRRLRTAHGLPVMALTRRQKEEAQAAFERNGYESYSDAMSRWTHMPDDVQSTPWSQQPPEMLRDLSRALAGTVTLTYGEQGSLDICALELLASANGKSCDLAFGSHEDGTMLFSIGREVADSQSVREGERAKHSGELAAKAFTSLAEQFEKHLGAEAHEDVLFAVALAVRVRDGILNSNADGMLLNAESATVAQHARAGAMHVHIRRREPQQARRLRLH